MRSRMTGTLAGNNEIRVAVTRSLLLPISMFALGSPAVHAQEPGAALEEIVVTAQRREQSLQDVPVSVSVIGEQEILKRHISSFVDYLDTVPNVSLSDNGPDNRRNGSRNIAIRGIAPGERRETVAVYVGETPLVTGDPDIFDVERIEVLRGPQGTLYGKATTAGAVKIVPNAPDASTFSALADLSASNYQDGDDLNWEGRGMINVPLAEDVLALRASGSFRNMGGYIDAVAPDVVPARVNADNLISQDDINDEQYRAGRVALRYTGIDRLTVTPSIHYQEFEADFRATSQPSGAGELERILEAPEPSDSDLFIGSLEVNYDWGAFGVTSVSSWTDSDFLGLEELSPNVRAALRVDETVITIPTPVEFGSTREEFTQELRLAYASDRLNTVFGVYYSELNTDTTSFYADPRIIDLIDDPTNVNETNAPGGLLIQSLNMTDEEELSFFLDVGYFIHPDLELLAGVRYYEFDTRFQATTGGRIFGGGPANSIIGPLNSADDDGALPKLGLNYHAGDNLTLYAVYSEGFRLGGTNDPLPDTPQCNQALEAIGLPDGAPPGFSAESLENVEAGVKTNWHDGRIMLNVAAFHMEWTDLQETTRPSGDCPFAFVNNVGSAESTGFEFELAAQITDNLYFSAGLGYVDAEVTSDPAPGSTVQKRKGDPLTDVSDLNYNVVGEYSFALPISSGSEGYVRLDYSYVAERFRDFGISPGVNPDYDLLNARIGLRMEDWEVALFARNLANEIATLDVFSTRKFTTRPRLIGLNVRKTF